MIAAQIATLKWNGGRGEIDKVGQIGCVSVTPERDESAMQQYLAMGLWTQNGSGIPQVNVNNMIQRSGSAPDAAYAPAYASIVDQSVYADAAKRCPADIAGRERTPFPPGAQVLPGWRTRQTGRTEQR